MDQERLPRRILEFVPTWKTKKGKTSKFVDAGGYNRNEREENWRLAMGRQRRMEKENKFTLGTEKCENTKNPYMNKINKHTTCFAVKASKNYKGYTLG